ncbi:MAG: PP2C family protein-serine/threonine phosphatase [Wenzhouxiangella sp.]
MSRDSGHLPRSAGQSDTGLVRANNQDEILLDEDHGLWLVADGMGGHAGGAQASRLARLTVQSAVHQGASLRAAILAAHYAIRSGQVAMADLGEMGTTVVALHEHGERYELAWVGDSRAYLFDPASGRLEQLTRDHNLAGLMVEAGAMTRAEAARHPRRHVLTDCLGLQGAQEPRIDQIEGQWQADQLMLLCSDGLSGEISDEQIAAVLRDETHMERKVQSLLEHVTAAGARDNVSIILIRSPLHSQADEAGDPRWRRWLRAMRSR